MAELSFRATPAGGPGGQHVNRSSTRVELWWNLAASPSLSEGDRAHLLTRLGHRLSADGALRLVAADTRSQSRNRDAVIERFVELLRRALVRPKARRKTAPPRAAREARLEAKRRQAARKRQRRRPSEDD